MRDVLGMPTAKKAQNVGHAHRGQVVGEHFSLFVLMACDLAPLPKICEREWEGFRVGFWEKGVRKGICHLSQDNFSRCQSRIQESFAVACFYLGNNISSISQN